MSMTPVKFKFLTPMGDPIALQEFTVSLNKAAYHSGSDGFVYPDVTVGTTDAQGEATLELFPANVPYYVEMTLEEDINDETCCAKLRFRIAVPKQDTLVWADDLVITDPIFSQAWDAEAIETILQAKAAAAASASAAATSAAASANSATSSAGSATASANSATASANSATASAGSANTASTKASESAASAADSLASRNQAEGFKTAAETASTNATASSTLAQKWAANPEDSVVSGGLYSSFHYSRKAAAFATNAASAATSASNSATTATTKAGEASTSASAAAADKATVAADKANVAADKALVFGYKTDVAADKAAVSVFALRYAGSVAVAPTTRTDGSALQAGDEYFNTGNQLRYNWSGSAWVQLNQSVAGLTATLNAAGVATYCAQMTEANMNNADIPNGKYTVAVSGVGNAPIQQNGYLDVMDNLSAGYQKRTYTTVVSGRTFTQLQVAGVFQPWKEETPNAVTSIANLRLITKGSINVAHVLGYYAFGDNGGGWYYYDSTDTTSTDNGGTIIVGADGGRWKRSTTTGLTVLHFGGKADGAFNNTPVVTAMIAAGFRDICYGAVGTFHHTSAITIPQNVNIKFSGIGFRMTTLTASAATGFQLFSYQRVSGQAPSVATFEDLVMRWTGTANIANSAAISYYGASDAESDCWFRTERCSFYGWQWARSAKWAGQVHSTKDFFSNNTIDNNMLRGCSFWYYDSSMSFSPTFIKATDTLTDAFSNGLFINGCHNVTAAAECVLIQGWQAVFIDSCGFDLGTGGTAAVKFINSQDLYVDKCFISGASVSTRDGVVFDNSHTGAVTDCTLNNNGRAIRFLNSSSAISQKITVRGCKFQGNMFNDILLSTNTQGCKFVENHHQTSMDRTGTNYEVYGSLTGAGNNICKFNTFAGVAYTPDLGAGSIVGENIFGCKP
jgi:hypothetical protein